MESLSLSDLLVFIGAAVGSFVGQRVTKAELRKLVNEVMQELLNKKASVENESD